MLQKEAKYWAAGIGALVAAGAVGVAWHYRGLTPETVVAARSSNAASPALDKPLPALVPAPSAPKVPEIVKVEPAQPVAAEPAPAAPLLPNPPEEQRQRPQFDIVRVEPTGEAVIAGHGEPKAKVAVTDHGQVVAETDADETGQFVILPPAFAPGGHDLGLTSRIAQGAPIQSPGTVGIDVPLPKAKSAQGLANPSAAAILAAKSNPPTAPTSPLKVATNQEVKTPTPPNAAPPPVVAGAIEVPPPATLSSAQTPPPSATSANPVEPIVVARSDASVSESTAAAPRVAVTGVASDAAGRLVATGSAPVGAFIRLYLNGSFLASVTAGADGLWSLTVEHGMKGGGYSIRADEIDQAKDAVISRAEVPFNFAEHAAELAASTRRPAPAPIENTPVAAPAPPSAEVVAQSKVVAPPRAEELAASASTLAKPVEGGASHNVPADPASSSNVASAAPTPVATPTPTSPPAAPKQASLESPSNPRPNAAHAVVRTVDTTKVVPGDSLWAISAHLYGNGLRYTQIYAANASQIRNPRLIYPGQIFVLPQPTPF
jgi:nucleoid-associated protein YgaU